MINKITRYIFLLFIALSIAILFSLNGHKVIFSWWWGDSREISLALLLLGSLLLGITVCGLVGLFFGFKSYLRERALCRDLSRLNNEHNQHLLARAALLLGEPGKATAILNKITGKNIVAKIDNARALMAQGELIKAGEKLVELRSGDKPAPLEVLLISAELEEKRGNLTAALDFWRAILRDFPSAKGFISASLIAEKLHSYRDAILFYKEAQKLDKVISNDQEKLAKLEILNGEHTLQKLSEIYPKSYTAALEYAKQLFAEGDKEAASLKQYRRAASLGAPAALWFTVVHDLLGKGEPDKAIAFAKTAISECGSDISGKLLLADLYLKLGKIKDAGEIIAAVKHDGGDKIEALAARYQAVENSRTRELHGDVLPNIIPPQASTP